MKKFRIGVIVGKFDPFHKGHELLIKTGAALVDHLYVLVSRKTPTDLDANEATVSDIQEFARVHQLKNVWIIGHRDKSPEPVNIDEHGTVLDPEFQDYWINEFQNYAPTHIISSDRYGQVLAKKMGIDWIPVDPDRVQVPISATKIKEALWENFKYISDCTKHRYVKKVAVIGPESTGKSTMVADLGRQFGCTTVPEYGRVLSELKGNELVEQDFYDIAQAQQVLIDSAVSHATVPLVISDTEGYTTYLFGEIYCPDGNFDKLYYEHVQPQDFDLYIILAPTVPWKDDGTRVVPEFNDRAEFFNELGLYCVMNDKNYVVIDSEDFTTRTGQACNAIMELIKKD